MSLISRLTHHLFAGEISRQASQQAVLAVRALDDPHDRLAGRSGASDTYPRDRRDFDRREILSEALEAWRSNPLARRIVELTSQYVVGGGLGVEAKNERTQRFIQSFWNHRLNRMPTRAFDLCDELTRTGNLFIILSTDPSGMSYVRALPTADVLEIESQDNDVEQELRVWEAPDLGSTRPVQSGPGGILGYPWKAYDENSDAPGPEGFDPVILHYAVNRPVGAKWGESDLAPMLRWLARYNAWLEDRARINRYRQAFIYVVKAAFTSQAERLQRQAELNANPPNPGSILVADSSEEWSVMAPSLASHEAGEDGLALKKMIAVGSGNPLHFLAEPESATRTTAESAGGPTFRHYEQRQQFFLWLIEDLVRAAVRRRALVDARIPLKTEISVRGADISARDNSALAIAASSVIHSFLRLRERGLIDDAELLRLAYRFAGEVVDVEEMLRRGAASPPRPGSPAGIQANPAQVDPARGEPANA